MIDEVSSLTIDDFKKKYALLYDGYHSYPFAFIRKQDVNIVLEFANQYDLECYVQDVIPDLEFFSKKELEEWLEEEKRCCI